MRLIISLFFFSVILSLSSKAQTSIDWEMLSNIEYKYRYNVQYNDWYDKAKFSEELLDLENKEVVIKGYMIPLDLEGKSYVLSKYPNSSCFFCGGAGQETVMMLYLNENEAYKMDEVVTLKGTLILKDEIYELNYVLENAELVKRGN